ncbi:hypothetical protein ABIE45_006325 [Methylobacterium sp. OAE515]|uniref:hypothetical protein n=1 Tax=Methylobacterium sp. OAE515 TaxID=2817895 RepID=UPI00178B341E
MPRVTSVSFSEGFQKRHLYLDGSSKPFEKHARWIETMRHERGTHIRGTITGTGKEWNSENPIGRINPANPSTVIRADNAENMKDLENAIINEMDSASKKVYLAAGQTVSFSLNLPDHQNIHYNNFQGAKYKSHKNVPVHGSTHVRLGGKLTSTANGELNICVNHLDSTSDGYTYEPVKREKMHDDS